MESNIKEFVDYLQYIGFLHKESIPLFINIFNSSQTNAQPNNDEQASSDLAIPRELSPVLISTISSFLSNLQGNQLTELSKGIVNKFSEHKKRIKQKFLHTVFNIYVHQLKKRPFTKWKNYKSDKKNINILYEKPTVPKTKNSPTSKLKYFSNKIHLQLNNNKPDTRNEISISNEYFQTQHYQQKSSSSFESNFLNRQEQFIQRQKANKTKQENRKEEELRLLYTFAPKVNNISNNFSSNDQSQLNYYSSNNHPISINKNPNLSIKTGNKTHYNRLYRNKCLGENQLKKNSTLYNNTKSNKSSGDSKPRTRTTSSRHEQLYKDYKTLENKKKQLQKNIDTERGLTFKPKSFTSNSGYTIQGNFDERNKKLLEDRQNFVFVYNYLRDRKYNDDLVGNESSNKMIKEYAVQKRNDIDNLIQNQRSANEMMYSGQMKNGEEFNRNYFNQYGIEEQDTYGNYGEEEDDIHEIVAQEDIQE